MKIDFVNFRSQAQEDIINNLLEELGSIIPKKVLRLIVKNWDYNDADMGAVAAVDYDTSYHYCELHVYNKFFILSEEEMLSTLYHELLHSTMAEYTQIVKSDMLQYIKEHNEPLAEQFRRQLDRAEESMVTQLEYFIMESIRGKRN